MEAWSITTLLLAFAGGAIGASLGAIFAIAIDGVFVLAGLLVVACGGGSFVLLQIALGPIFGPHVAFAGACAAAAYAAYIKCHPSGEGAGKDIIIPLMNTRWDVIVVGGIFGVLGHVVTQIWNIIPIVNNFDTVAGSIVVTNLIARICFQHEGLCGNKESIKKYGLLSIEGGRWLPWMNDNPVKQLIYGFSMGLFGAAMTMGVKAACDPLVQKGVIDATSGFVAALMIGWAISIIVLFGLALGSGNAQMYPVTHAMTVTASLVFLYSGSILAGGIAGIVAIYVQEFVSRLSYNHASSHIDPPAFAITICAFFVNIIFKPEFLNFSKFFQ